MSNTTLTLMPSYNFTLKGYVLTGSNAPVSNGTVRINAFNNVSFTNTATNGFFQKTLSVPPDAPDGLYLVSVSFRSTGNYGPSSNFTWVNVIHEPLNFTINSPSIIISGFGGAVSGRITSNGSALANCAVSVSLPWNVFYGKSDSSGLYSIPISVPIGQFSPVAQATIEVNPSQPYVETVTTSKSIGLFNPLYLILPGIIVGVVVYEIRNLELFSRKEVKSSLDFLSEKLEILRKQSRPPNSQIGVQTAKISRIYEIYTNALGLAMSKLLIKPRESLTIRETADRISKADEDGKGSKLFSEISEIMEDYAYSRSFDESRITRAEELLSELETVWAKRRDTS